MAVITLNTTLFNTIEFNSEDGLWEYYTIVLDSKKIEIRLDIEAEQNDENIVQIQKHLDNIPQMIQKAKATFIEKYPLDETVRMFVDFQMDEIDEENLLSCFDVNAISEVTPKRFIEELKLCGVSIDGNAECIIDFCLDENITGELLVVHFDHEMKIINISHES